MFSSGPNNQATKQPNMSSRLLRVSAQSLASMPSFLDTTHEGSQVYKETFPDRIRQWRNWLYGSDSDCRTTVMGRRVLDWVLLVVSYLVFVSTVVALGVVCTGIFFWVTDWNVPSIRGSSSFLQTPGLSFRPQPDTRSTVVRFLKGEAYTYTHYLHHIEAYLRYYENKYQQGENYIDCNEVRGRRVENLDKVCRFDLIQLGEDCVKQKTFGYSYGQPCILLRLNKIFDWVPEEYTNETVPDAIRYDDDGKELWSQWWITVKCDGETATDRENMGPILYYPAQGFHFKHFPFRNQQGYRSPLVFVRFDDPRPGILLMITCKAWAKNIDHDSNEMSGTVHFEVMMD